MPVLCFFWRWWLFIFGVQNLNIMKKTNTLLKAGMAVTLIASCISSKAQLPTDYITKVSYVEKKEVTYSMPSAEDVSCLSLAELAQYHGYSQLYRMDEYVDLEGDLLSDKVILDEQNVRDDWMEDFSRITVGKHMVQVYAEDGSVFHESPREVDSNSVYLSPEQSEAYGALYLDQVFYDNLLSQLMNTGLVVSEGNNRIFASNPMVSFTYDHNAKTTTTTEFDSSGIKVKETLIEYATSNEGDTYYPKTEVIFEWILTDSGCCVRKITEISRYAYEREVNPVTSTAKKDKRKRLDEALTSIEETDFDVVSETQRNAFRIQSAQYRNQPLEIIVYDMAGRTVMKTMVNEGEAIQLPPASRKGMYLVHIVFDKRKKPVVGKIIKSSSFQF
jgi:hypothetical protein